jgi:hypothetical protein
MNEIEKLESDESIAQGDTKIIGNFSDLFGGKVPLTKLFTVVANGVGKLTESYFNRKQIKNSEQEIKMICDAIGEKRDLVDEIKYDNNKGLVITAKSTVEERTLSRIDYQQQQKQENIESITSIAFEQLVHVESVSEEPVNDDWITRFFNMAEDISNEDMQLMWGKVLAGEIKQPKSFSLRTLELLKNISREEAETFEKISHYCIKQYGRDLNFIKYDQDYFDTKGIHFNNFMELIELGIIHNVNGSVYNIANDNMFIYGNHFILAKNKKNKESKEDNSLQALGDYINEQIDITAFTSIGRQLLSLVEPVYDESYLIMFISNILKDLKGNRHEHRTAQYGKIIAVNEDKSIKCEDLIDVPIT